MLGGVFFILASSSAYSAANGKTFQPGDVVTVNLKTFGYQVRAGGEPNFIVPAGERIRVIERVGDGYLVESVPEWKDAEGKRKAGYLLLADEADKAIILPTVQFVVYPATSPKKSDALSLVLREGPSKAPVKKSAASNQIPSFDFADSESESSQGNGGAHHSSSLPKQSAEAPASVAAHSQLKLLKSAYLRAGPSTNDAVVGSLKAGASVTVLETSGDWSRIENGSVKAWVRNDFLEGPALPAPQKTAAPTPPVHKKSGCVSFFPEKYNAQSVKAFVKQQNALNGSGEDIKKKKKLFFEYFAPLAAHLSGVSGYPSSVILAQFLEETGWGTSEVLGKANNLAGVSCFQEHKDFKTTTLNFSKSGKTVTVSAACFVERPKDEGFWYRSFPSLIQAGYAYVHNLVENQKTAANYQDIRAAIKNPNLTTVQRRRAVVAGLKKYAPNNYPAKISAHIAEFNLDKYDNAELCK